MLTEALVPQAVQVLRRSFIESYVALAPGSKKLIEQYADQEITGEGLRQHLLADTPGCFVVTDGFRIAGVMELTHENPPNHNGHDCLRVHRLYIAPENLGQGYGKSLLAKAENMAQELKCNKLWLSVWDLNHHAIGFYEALGFARQGVIPWEYETPDDARKDLDLVFEKKLT